MLLPQNFQEIPANFTGISPQILSLHGFPIFDTCFPTSDVGYPHSIPVNQIPFKYYNGNVKVTCNPHKFEIPALRFSL